LAAHLRDVVSNCQSAFINKHCIQDNFLFVQNAIRCLYTHKTPALFLKLDISKTFDSVYWGYLLELLQRLGFGLKWWQWISIFFVTATSGDLLNGIPSERFTLGKGIRQGSPLSPRLFILAADPLHRMIELASEQVMPTPIGSQELNLRISLYADDAAIFINPVCWNWTPFTTSSTLLDRLLDTLLQKNLHPPS
jgi:hypothetical protein